MCAGFAIRTRPRAAAPLKSLRASPFAPIETGLVAAYAAALAFGSLPPASSSSRTLRTWPVEQLARLAITPSGSSGLRRSSNSRSAWRREAQPSPLAPMVAFSTAFSRWQCRQSHSPPRRVQPSGRRGTALLPAAYRTVTSQPAQVQRRVRGARVRLLGVAVFDMGYLRGLEHCFREGCL